MLKPIPALASLLVSAISFSAFAAPEIGKPAPDFEAMDTNNQSVKLSAFKGKVVVLEWTNPECPFVKKHYEAGNMQQTQKTAKAEDAVWITINSSALGREGHQSMAEANRHASEVRMDADHIILDEKGTIGHSYEAKTTPHMFVVDAKGNLAYMGAIDNKPTVDKEDIVHATNYVTQAVRALKLGKKVEAQNTKPYGCGVKY
jgi:peroxiredoxin